jgi:phosphatidyl-myo-inositol dimannoside synthase
MAAKETVGTDWQPEAAMESRARHFVAVLPKIRGGGVERIGQTAVGVMWQFARENGLDLDVFSVCDTGGVIQPAGAAEPLEFAGFRGDKIRCAYAVLRLARRTRLLFLGHPNLAPLGYLARALNSDLRYGVMAHGIEVWRRLSPMRRKSLCSASLVVAPSRYTADKIVELQGVQPQRVSVVPHGIENPILQGKDGSQPGGKGPVLLSVARMESGEGYKGIDAVLKALRPVVQQIPELTYFIVGEGNDRPKLEALSQKFRLERNVVFTGRIPDSELWEHYARCDMFVLPSTGEGFGLVFVEAMSFGKPVIASRTGAAPEIVKDGINGLLVEGQNEEELTDRILRLATDQALQTRMGEAARRTFEDNYSLPKYRARLTEFLQALAF